MSTDTIVPGRSLPPVRRPLRLLRWVAVACVAAVLIEAGAVTDGFGIPSLLARHSSPSSAPNPNPFEEKVLAVDPKLVYGMGGASTFSFPNGADLCSRCPMVPVVNTNVTPAVAGVWVYFNITYHGQNYTHVANFSVSTSGANGNLFTLGCVSLQSSRCNEQLVGLSFLHNQTWAVEVYVYAASVPYNGGDGYTITFRMTSP